MKFTLGFITGLGAAWAALAIWQKIPTLGEFVWEADAEPDLPKFEGEDANNWIGRPYRSGITNVGAP